MAEPTGTIEPINPFNQSFIDRIYNYINQPLNTEDPLQNLVSGVAEFIPGISTELAKRRGDKFGEALSYLDYLGGGGAKLALSPFLIARRKEIQQTLKTFDEDPILKGNESVKNSLKKELDQINKAEAEELRIKEQYEGFVKDPTKFGKKQPTKELADATKKTGRKPMSVDEIATQIRRNEEAGTPFMFRGERGIASLSNKPTYLAADALDPRLPEFSKKSLKILQPKFNKVLDVDNMPSDIDQLLTNREMYRSRPSRVGGENQMDFDIDRIRGNIKDSVNKTPSSINKETTDFFQKEGYDALRFPPRRFKGEGDTYISLDPLNNLSEFENVSPDVIQDLIRELARNQMK